MTTNAMHGIFVDVGEYRANPTQVGRRESYAQAALRIGRVVAAFNRRYRTPIRRVFMHPVEVSSVTKADPGFHYTAEPYRGGKELWVYVHIVRSPAKRLSDKELTDDMVRACRLMIERVCWQESLGTYRNKHLRWKARELPAGTAFHGLVASQRGTIYWEMMPSTRTREHECYIECPRCPEPDWARLVEQVEKVVSTQRTLRVEDIGYIVPKRTGELVVGGRKERLRKLPALLRPVFTGRAGATARLRPSMSEAKGTLHKLG